MLFTVARHSRELGRVNGKLRTAYESTAVEVVAMTSRKEEERFVSSIEQDRHSISFTL